MMPLPFVGIPADFRRLAGSFYHTVDDAYIRAILDPVGALPIVIPAIADRQDFPSLLGAIDGILLTGSQSNVAPERYGAEPAVPGAIEDPVRDASNIPLIHAAVAAGVPLLAICRGFQELNVAFGGSLYQKLHLLPGRLDHRAQSGQTPDIQFATAHPVVFADGGLLRELTGVADANVNSLHWQGVDRLGQGLTVEAVAPDGTIEAVGIEGAASFVLAVQWHPEYRPSETPISSAIFAAFRQAVLKRRSARSAER